MGAGLKGNISVSIVSLSIVNIAHCEVNILDREKESLFQIRGDVVVGGVDSLFHPPDDVRPEYYQEERGGGRREREPISSRQ